MAVYCNSCGKQLHTGGSGYTMVTCSHCLNMQEISQERQSEEFKINFWFWVLVAAFVYYKWCR